MKQLYNSAMTLAKASNGNPVTSTLTVMLFYLVFSFLEASVERLICGDRFEHWLDPVFILGFIAYASLAVYTCAIYNAERVKRGMTP